MGNSRSKVQFDAKQAYDNSMITLNKLISKESDNYNKGIAYHSRNGKFHMLITNEYPINLVKLREQGYSVEPEKYTGSEDYEIRDQIKHGATYHKVSWSTINTKDSNQYVTNHNPI
jgi:hypothetical protein